VHRHLHFFCLNLSFLDLRFLGWTADISLVVPPAIGVALGCRLGRMASVRIGVVGDFSAGNVTHAATNAAYADAAAALGTELVVEWVPTVDLVADPPARLAGFHGILAAPGSPYVDMDGALGAIRHARERGIPFTGT
jgi:CTP synthase (UTP-ammonia lyase)